MRQQVLSKRFSLLLLIPVLVAGITGLVLLPSHSTMAAGDCTIGAGEVSLDASEQDLLAQLNAYRRVNGLSDLSPSPTLNKAAAWLARDMAQRRVMSHTDSLGRGLDRLADCGYRYYPAGENVAYGTGSFGGAGSVLNRWKGSPGHNQNMLSRSYKAVGIGVSCAGTACYWALDLGGVVDGTTTVTQTQPTPVPTTTVPRVVPTTAPTYYTYQTIPSSVQSTLNKQTYWVYSNGRWYGYTPVQTTGSDRFLSGLNGLYYFYYR